VLVRFCLFAIRNKRLQTKMKCRRLSEPCGNVLLERLHSPVSSVDYATAEHLSRLTPHRSVVFVSGNALLGHTPILKRATAYPLTVQLAILTECKLISQLARGVVLKDSSAQRLLRAIQTVMAGASIGWEGRMCRIRISMCVP